ncbi:CdaR family transcriptional regulator [Budvicia diplopodorum]|uniref:CdaR family transcriptional regulator n=1 Tax=Budvicia diplopodorum TaxID=1119056 RepID=UPI001358C8C0|nr:sugar diacid recognition domain-containing protein [Budvicia diplopodorum]
MLITLELANTIVKRAMSIIHHNVNVIDHQGIIIASGENHRIGERHEVAYEVIKNRQRMTIETPQQAAKYKNVQPGINHPIIVDDQVVMVIGISGNPVAIGRYAELAILTAELLVKQSLDIREMNWQYRIRDLLLKQYLELGDTSKGIETRYQLEQQDIHLNQPILPLIINIETGGHLLGKTIDNILNELSNILQSQRVILLSNDEILLIVTEIKGYQGLIDEINRFMETQLSHYTIGVGIESDTPMVFRQSIFMIKEMIKHGKQSHPTLRIINGKQLAFCGLLNEAKTSHFTLYFNQCIDKLLAVGTGSTLLHTLTTYIENNAEIRNTAQILGIHRNTLTYRLHQIEEITFMDPFIFKDLSQLMIALHYHRNKIRR